MLMFVWIMLYDIAGRYQALRLRLFADANPRTVVRCPAAECPLFVTQVGEESRRRRTVQCRCGKMFCFRCCDAPHCPASCKQKTAVSDWHITNTSSTSPTHYPHHQYIIHITNTSSTSPTHHPHHQHIIHMTNTLST